MATKISKGSREPKYNLKLTPNRVKTYKNRLEEYKKAGIATVTVSCSDLLVLLNCYEAHSSSSKTLKKPKNDIKTNIKSGSKTSTPTTSNSITPPTNVENIPASTPSQHNVDSDVQRDMSIAA